VCCSVLQCVAVCCSVLYCIAGAVQCVAVRPNLRNEKGRPYHAKVVEVLLTSGAQVDYLCPTQVVYSGRK